MLRAICGTKRHQLNTILNTTPATRLSHRWGTIIPAGADAEKGAGPETGQEDAPINFVGIIDMQLICESIDVVFDRARPSSHGHANVTVAEALGQKVENFDFPRRRVNSKRPPSRWHEQPSGTLGGSC